MSSPLEALPTELTDGILARLPTKDLVNLWKTNTLIARCTHDLLFGHLAAYNYMKKWACRRGDVEVIRAAVARDGDANFAWEPGHILETDYPPSFNEWGSEELVSTSTLETVLWCGHAKVMRALLDMGATFDALGCRGKQNVSNFLLQHIATLPPDMLEALSEADLGPWVLGTPGAVRSPMEFIKAGAPVNILRSIIQGRNLDCVSKHHSRIAWSPLSAAIDLGKTDIVEMLIEEGANINGTIQHQPIDSDAVQHYYPLTGEQETYIRYWRPLDVPIFAAARHMAAIGSTEMLDLCLRHGADINQRSPALRADHSRVEHFTTTPLTTYLESIASFPVRTGLHPITGIEYFTSHGADIDRNEAVDRWYFGTTSWLNVSSADQCVSVAMVELLLYKWNLKKLHELQFLNTIRHLIAQGSGMNRAYNIVSNFSYDSVITSFPLPQSDADHPDNVPMWWDVVQRLWDKLDEVCRSA